MTNIDIINRFIAVMNRLDWEGVYAMLHEDIVYHNIPFPPLHGIAQVRAFFGAVGTISDCDWQMIAIAATGRPCHCR